eukprot:14740133-Ditylum_brightwellii.AAC.1
MSYLQGTSCPDIYMPVHQCARGLVYKPDPSLDIHCYADADFAGSWNMADADNLENIQSRTGFMIMYAG